MSHGSDHKAIDPKNLPPPHASFTKEDALCINTIRLLAVDMVQKANSGHPGMPMGMAPIAHVLWHRLLNVNPANPKWINRDRFILSNGHGCALQYALLHLAGFNVTENDLKNFRQLDSITPGHPEVGLTPGVEVTTGPLGQGIANGVGMAMAFAHLAATFNKPGPDGTLFDNHVYVFAGDGCMQEGISHEAASLAGHLGLGNLIVLYDDNHVSIDGATSLSFSEDIPKRFESYGWHTSFVADGNTDLAGIEAAIKEAKAIKDKPSIICIRTVIGYGAPNAGGGDVHGSPLGADNVKKVKELFGFDPNVSFAVPAPVATAYGSIKQRGAQLQSEWDAKLARYTQQFPNEGKDLARRLTGKLPENWQATLPSFKPGDKADATRNISGVVLNALAVAVPELIGGSADLTPSTKTQLKCSYDFLKDKYAGRYLRFGVREHAMFAIANGIRAYGCLIPFTATFLNFIEYGFPAVRLAAISEFQQIAIMTHDSIGLGEDGPTHQPIEALTVCRATPNILTLRPADGNETVGAYVCAIENSHGPSVLALTRQNVPNLKGSSAANVAKGGYVLQDAEDGKEKPEVISIGTGSELSICVEAAAKIGKKVRVVSMPSWELFDRQPVEYRRSVLLPGVPVFSVEALSTTGWEKYAHFPLGMTTFGASAPYEKLYDRFGLTGDKIASRVKEILDLHQEQSKQMGVPVTFGLLRTHLALPAIAPVHHSRL